MKSTLYALVFSLAASLSNAAETVQMHTPVAGKPTATGLKMIDNVVGNGKLAVAGNTVTVHYTGWLYAPDGDKQHGTKFDSSLAGDPFTFELGAGKVIPGWDQGLTGMKVGGKRTLVVPAPMGYGTRGAGPIPPNANLIFDIELIGLK